MTDWVNAELDRMKLMRERLTSGTAQADKWQGDAETPDWVVAMMIIEKAIKHADKTGDVEPLREDLLHLTGHDLKRFLRPPRKTRGKKFTRDSRDLATQAARDVRAIRKLLLREFGHSKRPKGDFFKPEALAAERHGVSIESIESKLKKKALRS